LTEILRRVGPGSWLTVAGLVLAMALVLFLMGRVPICECGYVKLWHGEAVSSENSQHLSDWYSPSHFIHGLLFYWIAWLFAGSRPLGLRLVLATLVEIAWEIVENTDAVIQRYRETTIALDYFGDSVLNSVSDVAFMIVGFLLAARLPAWLSVAVAIALELFVGFMIRDNLTLNVLMLLWPLDAVRAWQGGA
jgi:hypothetical protein